GGAPPAMSARAPATTASAAPAHLPALDGLRGVAVLLVMLCHFGPELPVGTRAANAVARFLSAGWVGVDLFFVLSGFLITRILLAARGSPGYFKNFYARRVLRIFPLYYATLLMVFVVLPWLGATAAPEPAASHQAWLWTYTSNLLVARLRSFVFLTPAANLNHFWSLAIEEQFYLLWPLVVALLPRAWLLRATALGLLASPLLRLLLLRHGAATMTLYTLTPCRLDGLLAGAMLASVYADEALWARARRLAWPALAVGALGYGLIVRGNGPWELSRPMSVAGYWFVTLFFAGALARVLAAPDGVLARAMRARPWAWLGKYSYGLYVLHRVGVVRWLVDGDPMAMGRALLGAGAAPERAETVGLVAYVLVCTAVTVPLAYASYQLLERPFLRLKAGFGGTGAAVATATETEAAPRGARRRRRLGGSRAPRSDEA
ncbi:MAG: acyltransferase 3, partial [Myxococcaceae bacterium]|nr:acyltransferase 3 [Myxococcaceae bacterium]